MKNKKKKQSTKLICDEQKPNVEEDSDVFHRYPQAFVEAVRGTPLPPPDEVGSNLADRYLASTGVGLSAIQAQMQLQSDSEYDFLPAAGQMRLTTIEKAQLKRQRDKAIEELNSVLGRVKLTMDEFHTAIDELEGAESPDPEYEDIEEEERKKRERKIKRRRRRAQRKKKHEKENDEEEVKNAREETQALENLEMEEEAWSKSDENSNESSDEDESGDEENTKEETREMPGQVKRKVSTRMLINVG